MERQAKNSLRLPSRNRSDNPPASLSRQKREGCPRFAVHTWALGLLLRNFQLLTFEPLPARAPPRDNIFSPASTAKADCAHPKMQSLLCRPPRRLPRSRRTGRYRFRSGLPRLRHLQTFRCGRPNLGCGIYRRDQRAAQAVPRQNRPDETMAKQKRHQPTRPDAKETLAGNTFRLRLRLDRIAQTGYLFRSRQRFLRVGAQAPFALILGRVRPMSARSKLQATFAFCSGRMPIAHPILSLRSFSRISGGWLE
jgi:hypothetical protein